VWLHHNYVFKHGYTQVWLYHNYCVFNVDIPTYSSIFADNHIIYCPLVVNSIFPFSSLEAHCCVKTTLGFVYVKLILWWQNPNWVRFQYIRKVSSLTWVSPHVVFTTIKCFNVGISTCGFYHNKMFLTWVFPCVVSTTIKCF